MKAKQPTTNHESSPDQDVPDDHGLPLERPWKLMVNSGMPSGKQRPMSDHYAYPQNESLSIKDQRKEEPHDPPEPPHEVPPIEIGHEDLNLTPPQDGDPDKFSDIVMEPAVDHLGRPLDPAAEGIGEPDPLVLAKSLATLMSTTHRLIPGPTGRAEAQDQDTVLAVVKDWVRQRVMPKRLELDFGESQLKAYVKVIPALRLCQLPAPNNLDILVKTDIQGEKESERYCMPEKLINTFIKELHLRLSHYGVETMVLTMRHLIWFPHMWTRVRQVLQVCAGCGSKTSQATGQKDSRMILPKRKGERGQLCTSGSGGPPPTDSRRLQVHPRYTMQFQWLLRRGPYQEQGT